MKINKIVIENFRQFHGKHEIEFSTSAEKNIFVILGDNGSGKTTLNQAFLFCIYGITKVDFSDIKHNYRNPIADKEEIGEVIKLCNDKKRSEEKDFSLSVKLHFEHRNSLFEIERKYKFYWSDVKRNYSMGDEIFEGKVLDPKNFKGVKDFREHDLRMILPSSLSDIFFFDGERMQKMATDDAKSVISDSVINILGLSTFRYTLNYLKKNNHTFNVSQISKTVENLIKKELVDDNNDNKIKLNRDKLDRYEEELEEIKKERGKAIREKSELDDEKNSIDEKLNMLAADREKQKTRKLLENRNDIIEKDILREQKNLLENFTEKFYSVLTYKFADEVKGIIKNSTVNDRGITGINGNAIDALLERKKCLCGTGIERGGEAYNNLVEWKNFLPPKDLSSLLVNVQNKIEESKQNKEKFTEKLNDIYNRILELKVEKEDNNKKIEEISVQNLNEEEIEQLESRRRAINEEIHNKNVKLITLDRDISNKVKDIEVTNKEIEEASKLIGKNIVINKKLELLNSVYGLIESMSIKNEENAKKYLQKEATSNYEKMLTKNFKIKLNEDYSYDVFDEDGIRKTSVLSEGERIITSFAFIGALVKAARMLNKTVNKNQIEEEAQEYPLVMDAPFAKVDNKHKNKVASLLPSFANQVIICSVDSQWEGAIENSLKGKVSKIIKLKYDKNDKTTYIEEDIL